MEIATVVLAMVIIQADSDWMRLQQKTLHNFLHLVLLIEIVEKYIYSCLLKSQRNKPWYFFSKTPLPAILQPLSFLIFNIFFQFANLNFVNIFSFVCVACKVSLCNSIVSIQCFSSGVELTGSEGHANIFKTLFCSLFQHNESVHIGSSNKMPSIIHKIKAYYTSNEN